MRYFILLAAILPALACATAQSPSAAESTPFVFNGRIDLATPVAVVPLRKEGEFYFVDVLVNGKPFKFTLETGAGFTAISTAAARALGMNIGSAPVLTPGQPGVLATIDSLTVGPVIYRGVSARVTSSFDNMGFDGIIGVPLLRNLLVTLDLSKSRLVMQRGSLAADGDVLPVAGKDRGERVDVIMDFAGTSVPVVLDTRSFIPIIFPDSLESTLRFEAPPRAAGMARGPSLGSFQLRAARLAGDASIGAATLRRAPITLRNRPGAVIGVPLIEKLEITLDLQNKRVRVRPAAAGIIQFAETAREAPTQAQTPAAGPGSMGFNLAGFPGTPQLRVVNVVAGSSADKAGLKNDDELAEFDGVPAAQMNSSVFRGAIARGTAVKVVVRRAGRDLTFSVTPGNAP